MDVSFSNTAHPVHTRSSIFRERPLSSLRRSCHDPLSLGRVETGLQADRLSPGLRLFVPNAGAQALPYTCYCEHEIAPGWTRQAPTLTAKVAKLPHALAGLQPLLCDAAMEATLQSFRVPSISSGGYAYVAFTRTLHPQSKMFLLLSFTAGTLSASLYAVPVTATSCSDAGSSLMRRVVALDLPPPELVSASAFRSAVSTQISREGLPANVTVYGTSFLKQDAASAPDTSSTVTFIAANGNIRRERSARSPQRRSSVAIPTSIERLGHVPPEFKSATPPPSTPTARTSARSQSSCPWRSTKAQSWQRRFQLLPYRRRTLA